LINISDTSSTDVSEIYVSSIFTVFIIETSILIDSIYWIS